MPCDKFTRLLLWGLSPQTPLSAPLARGVFFCVWGCGSDRRRSEGPPARLSVWGFLFVGWVRPPVGGGPPGLLVCKGLDAWFYGGGPSRVNARQSARPYGSGTMQTALRMLRRNPPAVPLPCGLPLSDAPSVLSSSDKTRPAPAGRRPAG